MGYDLIEVHRSEHLRSIVLQVEPPVLVLVLFINILYCLVVLQHLFLIQSKEVEALLFFDELPILLEDGDQVEDFELPLDGVPFIGRGAPHVLSRQQNNGHAVGGLYNFVGAEGLSLLERLILKRPPL